LRLRDVGKNHNSLRSGVRTEGPCDVPSAQGIDVLLELRPPALSVEGSGQLGNPASIRSPRGLRATATQRGAAFAAFGSREGIFVAVPRRAMGRRMGKERPLAERCLAPRAVGRSDSALSGNRSTGRQSLALAGPATASSDSGASATCYGRPSPLSDPCQPRQ